MDSATSLVFVTDDGLTYDVFTEAVPATHLGVRSVLAKMGVLRTPPVEPDGNVYTRAMLGGKEISIEEGLLAAHIGGINFLDEEGRAYRTKQVTTERPKYVYTDPVVVMSPTHAMLNLIGIVYFDEKCISRVLAESIRTYIMTHWSVMTEFPQIDITPYISTEHGGSTVIDTSVAYCLSLMLLSTVNANIPPLSCRLPIINVVRILSNNDIYVLSHILSNYFVKYDTTERTYEPSSGLWIDTVDSIQNVLLRIGRHVMDTVDKMFLPSNVDDVVRRVVSEALKRGVMLKDEKVIKANLTITSNSILRRPEAGIPFRNGSITVCEDRLIERPLNPYDFFTHKSVVAIPTLPGSIERSVAEEEFCHDYFRKMFYEDDAFTVFVRYMCSVFNITRMDKKILFLIGRRGDEGKTMLGMILHTLFGACFAEGSPTILIDTTGAKVSANSHTSHLAPFAEGKQLVQLSDIPTTSKINLSLLKQVSGCDMSRHRGAYSGRTVEYRNMSRLLVIGNDLGPMPENTTMADFNRMCFIEMTGRFVPKSDAPSTRKLQDAYRIYPLQEFTQPQRTAIASYLLKLIMDEYAGYMRSSLTVASLPVPFLVPLTDEEYEATLAEWEERKAEQAAAVEEPSQRDKVHAFLQKKKYGEVAEPPPPKFRIVLDEHTRMSHGEGHQKVMARYLHDKHLLYKMFRKILATGGVPKYNYANATPLPDQVFMVINVGIIDLYAEDIPREHLSSSPQIIMQQFTIIAHHTYVAYLATEDGTGFVFYYDSRYSFLY